MHVRRRLAAAAAALGVGVATVGVPAGAAAGASAPDAFGAEVTYAVTTLADTVLPDGACSLREALAASVAATSVLDDCGAGAGVPAGVTGLSPTVRIVFAGAGRGRHLLGAELQVPDGAHVLVDGVGTAGSPRVVLDGQGRSRVLRAAGDLCGSGPYGGEAARTLLLRDLTVTGGAAPEAPPCPGELGTNWMASVGGGVLAGLRATFIADRVSFVDNVAVGGAAVATMHLAAIGDATFAFNSVAGSQDGIAGWADAAVYVHNGRTSVLGSTFLHNRTDWRARDLATSFSLSGDLLTSLSAHANVHIAATGAQGFACHKHPSTSGTVSGLDTDSIELWGGTSSCSGDALLHDEPTLVPVGPDGTPLSPGADQRQALTDHGGWVDTVALATGARSHGHVTGLDCSTFLRGPDAHARSEMREDPRLRDARGLPRGASRCDAGSLERQAQTVSFPAPPAAQAVAGTDLPAVTSSSGEPVTVTTTTPAVCTASGAVVRLVAAGTCTATAVAPGSALHLPSPPVWQTFAVAPAPQGTPTLTFVDPPTSAFVGDTWTVGTRTDPSGLTVTTRIATGVSGCTVQGSTVTFTAPGTCTVQALTTETPAWKPVLASHAVTVAPRPQTIVFSPVPTSGTLRQSTPLTATGGGSGNPVVLSVPVPARKGDKPVCSLTRVATSGATTTATLTYLAAGTCTVTATQAGSSTHGPASGSLVVQVRKPGGRG